MDKKTMIVHAPEGYEIDEVNSTIREIVFKPIKKKLTYDDIAKELFENEDTFWMGYSNSITSTGGVGPGYADCDNCTSERQVEKLMAINQLMNVAKYLNDGWKPDWSDNEFKYNFYINHTNNTIKIDSNYVNIYSVVVFKTREFAEQAIEILGEDIIRLALSTDW